MSFPFRGVIFACRAYYPAPQLQGNADTVCFDLYFVLRTPCLPRTIARKGPRHITSGPPLESPRDTNHALPMRTAYLPSCQIRESRPPVVPSRFPEESF